MYVAIVGSRRYPRNLDVVIFVQSLYKKYPDAIVVSGGCNGVDAIAEQTARELGKRVISFRPVPLRNDAGVELPAFHNRKYWFEGSACLKSVDMPGSYTIQELGKPGRNKAYGRAAFARNEMIATLADHVVAFTVDNGGGTANTLAHARRLGKPIHETRNGKKV